MKNTIFFLLIIFIFLVHPGFSQTDPPKQVLIKNVNVWDGESDNLQKNLDVLIEGNHIKNVGPNISPSPGATIIDGKEKTLIPGLSDAHVHLMFNVSPYDAYNKDHWAYVAARATKTAENFLQLGFTTVRDMGGPVFGIKRAIDEGTIPGPRVYASGAFISQTSGHGDLRNPNEFNPHWTGGNPNFSQLLGWFYVVDGVDQVLNATRENLRKGAAQIKVMAGGGIGSDYDPLHTVQFTDEELRAAVQAAEDWGTYVAAHVYNSTGITRALNAGVKCIEHGHLTDEASVKLLKEKNAFLVPQSYWVMLDGSKSRNPAKFKLAQTGAQKEMDLAKKYKVNLAFGSDVFGDLGSEKNALKEFTARTKWFSPVEILKQATSINASLFALSGEINPYPDALGVIKKGAYADLLIYDGNPLEDIQVIVDYEKNLKFIMKDGEIYKNELED